MNAITHEPIAHALVLSPDNRFATISDEQGRFAFAVPEAKRSDSREAGAAEAEQNRPSSLLARKPGFLAEQESEPAEFVSPGQQNVIHLVPEALIIGQILLPASDYLTRMPVHLYRRVPRNGQEHWDNMRTVTSRADGTFRFAELPAGEYKLVTQEMLDRDPVIFDPNGQLFGYTPVYYPSAPDFAAAEAIHLAPGATFQANVSPVRHPYYTVKIPVANATSGFWVEVWANGRPSPGYSLAYRQQDSAIEGSLPDGTYTVQAVSFNNAPMTGTATITVSGGPATNASMMLIPSPSITVSVREEFQTAHELNQTTTVQDSDGGPRQFKVNSRRPNYLNLQLVPIDTLGNSPGAWLQPPSGPDDESLSIRNIRPGKYRVQANTGVGYIASMTLGGLDALRAPLQVDAGAALPAMEVTLRDDGADVEGTVDANNPDGVSGGGSNPRPGVLSVYFLPSADSSGRFQMLWVSPSGHFEGHQIAPGTYRVVALDHQDPGLQFASEEALARYASQTQIVQIAAGQKTSLHLSLIRGTP